MSERNSPARGNDDARPQRAQQALDLARHGLAVFPCRSDKRPYTGSGFKAATIDADTIAAWWSAWPGALIGVPTGGKFVVLDFDLVKHVEAKRWYDANHARLPLTRTHVTRSGGRHLLFQPHPGVKTKADVICKGGDTRGFGGYCIWWPAEGFEVLNADVLASVPEWVVALLNPAAPAPRSPRAMPWIAQDDDEERIASALKHINADNRDVWLAVGMALRDRLGEGGKPLWDSWSAASAKYDAADQDRVWRSIKRNGVTIATVFHIAQQAGWDPAPDRAAWKECGRLCWCWRRAGPRRAWDEFKTWCEQQGISAARAEQIFETITDREIGQIKMSTRRKRLQFKSHLLGQTAPVCGPRP